jgi:hypothetical protein
MNPDREPLHKAQKENRFWAPLRYEQRGHTLRALPSPRFALWYELPRLVVDGPDRMPQLDVTPRDSAASHGRPKIEDREPERVETAAMLRDLHGWSLHQITAAMHSREGPKYGGRDVKRGRDRLRRLGVLPWAAFPGAPTADWLRSEEFAAAVDQWRCEAISWLYRQRPPASMGELFRIAYEELKARHNIRVTPWRPPSPES